MCSGGESDTCGDRRGAYRVLVGKHERKRPPERHACGWDDDIKVDLKEIG